MSTTIPTARPEAPVPTCPPWCQVDHEVELRDLIARDERLDACLEEHGERLGIVLGPRDPDRTLIDYSTDAVFHRHLIGAMTVNVGGLDGDGFGTLEVWIEACDGDEQAIRAFPPSGWTEEYRPGQARELAALLAAAADFIEAQS